LKAVVLRAPGQLGVEEIEEPKAAPGEALVRVAYSGICGTDLGIFRGEMPVRHPLVMGHEAAGEVVQGGGDSLKSGARVLVDPSVFCGVCFDCRAGRTHLCQRGGLIGREMNGGFAEYVAVPQVQLFPLPDAIDLRDAPLIQVLATCVHAQRLVSPLTGQSVVITGLGVTGQLHIQLAKARGAYPVIGISRSAWKRRLAESLGADITLSSGAESMRGILEATEGRGADLAIECTGNAAVIAQTVSMVRPGGTILLFGTATATTNELSFYQMYKKELRIINTRSAKAEDFPASIELVTSGAVRMDRLITHRFLLTDLSEAMRLVESDEDQRMKIILKNC
jgi:2-desacetyl-2-hydroxyethyl bacteriochlorophyllide A dehydrogenase